PGRSRTRSGPRRCLHALGISTPRARRARSSAWWGKRSMRAKDCRLGSTPSWRPWSGWSVACSTRSASKMHEYALVAAVVDQLLDQLRALGEEQVLEVRLACANG